MRRDHLLHLFWAIVLLLVSGPVTPSWAQQSPQYYGPHMWGGGWWGWFFGPIMMIVFIVVLGLIVALLVRSIGGLGHTVAPHGPPAKTPVDILKERFARGEIDKEEYEERRRILGE